MFSQQNLFSTTSPEDLTTTDWLIRMFCEEERIYSSGWVANSRLLLIGFLEKNFLATTSPRAESIITS